ncbi:MAG: PAS domain S-box protein [Aestuariivirga sp.]|nr:PAS domain S-box protein [Aestuariivirga sp.]
MLAARTTQSANANPARDGGTGFGAGRAEHLETLYRLTDRLYRASGQPAMLQAALDAIGEGLCCDRCSILLFDAAGVMRFAAWRGLSAHYRKTLEGHTPWRPDTVDPEPIFVADIDQTEESEEVKRTIRAEGIRSLAFLPLTAQGKVIGKFMAYHSEPSAFGEAQRALAITVARQIGFSLERAQAEQARLAALRDLVESEQRFRLMAEHAPVMIWMCDAEGRCLHLNQMLRRFWQVEEEQIGGFDWRQLLHPDDVQNVMQHMGAALEQQESVLVTGRYRNASGEYRVLETLANPRFAADGSFMGLTGVNTDITERERAEKALRDSEERFRLVVEASPAGMVMTDGAGRILMINALCEKLFGYDDGELLNREIEVLVPPAMRQHHPGLRETLADRPPPVAKREVVGRRKDGRDIPLEIGVNPILTSDGLRIIATVADIAERKRAEAQRELLLAELNHRVKNTLAVVQGLAHQTFTHADSSARRAFEGRLQALATAHDLLTRSHWESTSLSQLVSDALQIGDTSRQRVSADGPMVRLNPHAALSIALALHELVTNTLKHGALSCDTGVVTLSWNYLDGGEMLRLEWRESGGPMVIPPRHKGFGSLLLERTLARDLDGRVELCFDPAGVVCVIEMPLR